MSESARAFEESDSPERTELEAFRDEIAMLAEDPKSKLGSLRQGLKANKMDFSPEELTVEDMEMWERVNKPDADGLTMADLQIYSLGVQRKSAEKSHEEKKRRSGELSFTSRGVFEAMIRNLLTPIFLMRNNRDRKEDRRQ